MLDYLNFATRAANRHERSNQWRAVTRAAHAELEDDREASIRGCDLGEVRLCLVSIGRHRIESEWRSPSREQQEVVKFLFQEEGECRVEQCGRIASLLPGQWCAIDKTEAFSIAASGPGRQLALVVPKTRIAEWQPSPGRLVAPQRFLRGTAQVLHASVSAAVSAAASLGRRDRARLGVALTDLLNVAWGADPMVEGMRTQRTRRLAVIEYVERHLDDPALDVGTIADALGYSKRTLHKLFADDATTIGRLIWDRRLERCRQELLDPALARRSITDIAHSWGFSDSQHFSRSFKARFGTSPRDFRNGHLPN